MAQLPQEFNLNRNTGQLMTQAVGRSKIPSVMAKTQYIFRSDDAWVLKSEGRLSKTFKTQREAVSFAMGIGKRKKSAQIVVFGKDGRVVERRQFGMLKIQNPPEKGRLDSQDIATAVGRVVLDRLRATGEHAS